MRMKLQITFSDVTIELGPNSSDGHRKANDMLAALNIRIRDALKLAGVDSHPDSVQLTLEDTEEGEN